jgi:Xaa-Pro dipeptidase
MNTTTYKARQAAFASWLKANHLAAGVFHDTEEHRDRSVRYLCGHPMDALLVVTADARALLVPWDVQMAALMAAAVDVTPLADYDLDWGKALKAALPKAGVTRGTVELPPYTTVIEYDAYTTDITACDFHYAEGAGSHKAIIDARAVKDTGEVARIQKAGDIACAIGDLITAGIKAGTITTETDAALLIERESRERGAEGTSFDTLAAGSDRSFGIHCFPNYTAGTFGATGLSILDFGVTFEGYRSDVTYTFVAPGATSAQKDQCALVAEAYAAALPLYTDGTPVREAANAVAAVFKKAGRTMPHGLGHGVGLDIHEYPRVNTQQKADVTFKSGMVITLEPGLYDPTLGGCRWENDILVTPTAPTVLTRSTFVYL